jgi:glycosyltransferase involved in cell wall biosynthesis/CDP-glycerol glycerophosphotransferase (TagB/SpsB family)
MDQILNKYIKNNAINKKIKKLKRDPVSFFTDMFENKRTQLLNHVNIKFKGYNNFTIVSAVYNAEKYLDDFFKSIVSQNLNFEKNIQIICVDDGSTDNSDKIIKKWIKKYPKNIEYHFKENGGQASARNLGLEFVKTKWVTFTDPDDFLNKSFFLNLDRKIIKDSSIKMIVSNLIFYFEKDKIYKDSHPLKYRFSPKKCYVDINNMESNIVLSVATTIFDYNIIKKNNLKFDERVKPVFEDGRFVADYCLNCESGRTYFIKASKYFYRKREDQSSTLDNAWKSIGKFDHVLRYGHLGMLKEYKEKTGNVPGFIQRTTLYDIAWYIKYLLNDDNKISHLSDEEKNNFWDLLYNIFEYIDDDIILNFNLAGLWFMHKVGMLGALKKSQPKKQIVYIENIDRDKKQILISYYTYKLVDTIIKINSEEVIPLFYKIVQNKFAEKHFVSEVRMWIPYVEESDVIDIFVDRQRSRISLFGKHYNSLRTSLLLSRFEEKVKNKYTNDGSWILIDRDTQADDNAEHLYRYIKQNSLKENCYFALRKSSSDWDRLKIEGFKLLNFGSADFEEKLKSCDKIISSHLDRYINNYFGDEYGYTKKFIFLQHGVTHNNLTDWFNSKKNLQCVVATSNQEYSSFVYGDTYKLTSKEVILSGFPRHDSLLNSLNTDNVILIMPTWRKNLVGSTIGDGNERILNSKFMDTEYAKSWYNVLHDSKLKSLALEFGYEVIFAPHANICPYLERFNVPSYIKIWTKNSSDLSIQNLFQKSKFMVTDYSSVAFDMAYLGKQVIYYQFDKKDFFSGSHIFKKGYFDYEIHGFGPIVSSHNDLIRLCCTKI